jgi:hypothetical protein
MLVKYINNVLGFWKYQPNSLLKILVMDWSCIRLTAEENIFFELGCHPGWWLDCGPHNKIIGVYFQKKGKRLVGSTLRPPKPSLGPNNLKLLPGQWSFSVVQLATRLPLISRVTMSHFIVTLLCVMHIDKTAVTVFGGIKFTLGLRWPSWLRHRATSREVAGSIPNYVIVNFHWHNPSGRTMALGSTQPLTEMSTRNIS